MPGEEISRRYSLFTGSSTSSTGDSASVIASQPATSIVPSGRSAMICSVVPSWPEILTLTRRKPRSRNTGPAIRATCSADAVLFGEAWFVEKIGDGSVAQEDGPGLSKKSGSWRAHSQTAQR